MHARTAFRLARSRLAAALAASTSRTVSTAADRAVVYTDGACIGNGTGCRKTGIGVYWGHSHPLNSSIPLPGANGTSNRAELSAVIHAIRQAVDEELPSIHIRTDSQLVAQTVNEWLPRWKANGWRRVRNAAIANLDLVAELDALLERSGVEVSVEHVKGHSTLVGNNRAHELAQRAVAMCEGVETRMEQ